MSSSAPIHKPKATSGPGTLPGPADMYKPSTTDGFEEPSDLLASSKTYQPPPWQKILDQLGEWRKGVAARPTPRYPWLEVLSDDPLYGSGADVSDLEPVDCSQLIPNERHEGRVLICRIASSVVPGLTALVAALCPKGHAVVLALQNCQPLPIVLGEPTPEDWDAAFPLDAIVAIKEPALQGYTVDEETSPQYFMTISSPTDIVLLEPQAGLLRGVEWKDPATGQEWRKPDPSQKSPGQCLFDGNSHFEARRPFQAEVAYSQGLSQRSKARPPVHFLLYLNRSAARLELHRYQGALEDAMAARTLTGNNTRRQLLRAYLRTVRALFGLRKWPEALYAAHDLKTRFPESPDAAMMLEACKQRIREARYGQYRLLDMLKQMKAGTFRFDVADYVGPIEVKASSMPAAGRGVVATRDIHAGELLLAEKPIAFVDPSDTFTRIPNQLAPIRHDVWDVQCCRELAYLQSFEPSAIDKVQQLSCGLIEVDQAADQARASQSMIDPQRNLEVCLVNNFATINFHLPRSGPEEESYGCALYEKASIFNHSCAPNAARDFIGDIIFARAMLPIKQGNEVDIPYAADEEDYLSRQMSLANRFKHCSCHRCSNDRQTSLDNLQKRKKALDDCKKIQARLKNRLSYRDQLQSAAELIQLLEAAQSTFPPDAAFPYRLELFLPYRTVSFIYIGLAVTFRMLEHYETAVEYIYKALGAVGLDASDNHIPSHECPVSMTAECAGLMAKVAVIRAMQRRLSESSDWLEAAKWLHSIFSGSEEGLFELQMEQEMDELTGALGPNGLSPTAPK